MHLFEFELEPVDANAAERRASREQWPADVLAREIVRRVRVWNETRTL